MPSRAPTTAFVQVAGSALRIPFAEFHKETFASAPLLRGILEFVQRQHFALTQLAACNGLHEIEKRLARWLLMVQDRVESPTFYLTQEFLATMLGIRRTSVSLTAGRLQQSGLIEYRRGHISILDQESSKGQPASATRSSAIWWMVIDASASIKCVACSRFASQGLGDKRSLSFTPGELHLDKENVDSAHRTRFALANAAIGLKLQVTPSFGKGATDLTNSTHTRWCSSTSPFARSMSTFFCAANSVVTR